MATIKFVGTTDELLDFIERLRALPPIVTTHNEYSRQAEKRMRELGLNYSSLAFEVKKLMPDSYVDGALIKRILGGNVKQSSLIPAINQVLQLDEEMPSAETAKSILKDTFSDTISHLAKDDSVSAEPLT